ncbi:hypothetical protein [Vagococcus silagei]|uniref:Uncharacterized protein n=1 Tax=Vagococcus silagei TaxID=2508885 RepID=A0A4S3B672_9ENTE|nr:hypothetical protein [Vagococcus silagei]THB62088.1 hypothetical protein ESZ54_02460 [Vagococcus silagei]
MPKKKLAVSDITSEILCTPLYVEKGTLILVRNNTERNVYTDIDFFEIVYNGDTLTLNFSIVGTDARYDKSIELSPVHNINGVLISSED